MSWDAAFPGPDWKGGQPCEAHGSRTITGHSLDPRPWVWDQPIPSFYTFPRVFPFPNPLEKIKKKKQIKQISLAVAKLSPESGQLGEIKPQPTPARHIPVLCCCWAISVSVFALG